MNIMRIIKPRVLRKGDVIGIAAPASPLSSEEKLTQGIHYLETLGYRVELGAYARKKRGYLAGTDLQRASDINNFFLNPRIKAIFTVRGGYGSHRILPYIDYHAVKQRPKILVGYSDITALHLALFSRTGLVTFSGPMVAVELAEGLHGETEEQFWGTLTSSKYKTALHHGRDRRASIKKKSNGRIMGGNLSLITALIGTPYFPADGNLIWLFEEIGERPYRIDRMFQQFTLNKTFQKSKGILLGRFIDCAPEKKKPSLSISQVINDTFEGYRYPVMHGIRFGHMRNSLTIPLGVRIEVNPSHGTTRFLESGVA